MWTEAHTVDKLVTVDAFADMKWPDARSGKPDPFSGADRDKVLAYLEWKMPCYYSWVFTDDFFFLDSKAHGIRHDFWATNNWARICKAAKVRPRKFYATRGYSLPIRKL